MHIMDHLDTFKGVWHSPVAPQLFTFASPLWIGLIVFAAFYAYFLARKPYNHFVDLGLSVQLPHIFGLWQQP